MMELVEGRPMVRQGNVCVDQDFVIEIHGCLRISFDIHTYQYLVFCLLSMVFLVFWEPEGSSTEFGHPWQGPTV